MKWLFGDWYHLLGASWAQIALVVCAMLCGTLIDTEREKNIKPAGLRTMILIALGSALFTMVSYLLAGDDGDHGRVAAQIVSGIDIFRYRRHFACYRPDQGLNDRRDYLGYDRAWHALQCRLPRRGNRLNQCRVVAINPVNASGKMSRESGKTASKTVHPGMCHDPVFCRRNLGCYLWILLPKSEGVILLAMKASVQSRSH